MFVPGFFPRNENFVQKQNGVPEEHNTCDRDNQMRLFEDFLQRKLADFRKLESFRPKIEKEVSHSDAKIMLIENKDIQSQGETPASAKDKDVTAPEDLVITIDSDTSEQKPAQKS